MEPKSAPWISCAAYAKSRGLSPNAVSVAIRAGRLVKSVVRIDEHGQIVAFPDGQPKIADPALADQELAENTDHTRARTVPVLTSTAPRGLMADERGPATQKADEDDEPAADGSMATAAARDKHWRAKLAELKFKAAAKELVPAAEVRREWADLLSQVRTKLLGIPTRVRQAIPTLTVGDVLVVENLVRESLEDLVDAEEAR